MRALATLALLALICFLRHTWAAPVAPQSMNQDCCPQINQNPVPKGKVKHVAAQHGCRHNAIIVTSVCDKKFCIDGNWKWARELLRDFQNVTANGRPASAPFNVLPCKTVRG